MKAEDIVGLCKNLEKENAVLIQLKTALGSCNLSGHQNAISVNIQGVGNIDLTYNDRSTGWAERLIRGNEMIMLGVKKGLAWRVEKQLAIVKRIEDQIAHAKVTI